MTDNTAPARPEIRIMLPESSLVAASGLGDERLPIELLSQLVCQETCSYLTSRYPEHEVVVTHGRVVEPIVVASRGGRASEFAFEREVRSALGSVPDVRAMSEEEIESRLQRLHSWVKEG